MKMRGYSIFPIVSALFLVMAIVVSAGAAPSTKGPIKIGVIYPATGGLAVQGISMTNATKQLFEEKGMQVAGRKIELVVEDDEAKPDVGLTKTKKVVELDKVNVINGYLSTVVAYAVRDYLHQVGVPALITPTGAGHTRKQFSPSIFRVVPATYQYSYEPGKWLAKRGYKKALWVGADAIGPRETFAGFKKGFEEGGGQVVQELWAPWGTNDYGPYISAFKVREADILLPCMWGNDAIRIVNQLAEYGLKGRIPIFGMASFTDEGVTLPPMGSNAEGILSSYVSCPSNDNPENKRFVEGYKRRYNALPGQYSYLAYVTAQATYEAMDKVKGNVEDREKFLDALRKVKFTTPMGGKGYFDERQSMVYDLLILEARKTNGECHIFEIDRIKEVKDPVNIFP